MEKIRNSFKGRVFVEKPGVMSLDDLDLIKDEKVSVGMVERFNPSRKGSKYKTSEKYQ